MKKLKTKRTSSRSEHVTEVRGDYSMASTLRATAPGNLRGDAAVRGNRTSLLGDVEAEAQAEKQRLDSIPKAAVVYVTKGDKVLAVTRFGDATDLNMPGGGVEHGEDPLEAAARELWEETGIKADELFPVFTRVSNGKLVTTFKVTSYHGKLKPSHEGVPSWETRDVLLGSSFGDYFREMLESLHGEALSESRKITR